MRAGPGTGADPFASMRQVAVPQDPQAQVRMWQLQQLQARHMVLEQQAKSAATATSKTQREVYVGGLAPGVVSGDVSVSDQKGGASWCWPPAQACLGEGVHQLHAACPPTPLA